MLKATGHGLAIALSRLTVTAPEEAPALIAWTADTPLESAAHLYDLDAAAGNIEALAVLCTRLEVAERDARPLFTEVAAAPSGKL